MQDVFAAAGSPPLEEASRHGLGHLTRIYGSAPVSAVAGAAELVRQQRIVMESSRLGIPALVHEECLTGFTAYGATVYPAAIAWAATFDPDLVERMAAAIGRDMAALGVHQGLSPVLDVVRDYRWGRVEETMGEDPYLVAILGAAYVRGLQSAGVLATLKHFAGYSASRGARNHGPVPMGRRELIDVILPPFETAVALAGAGSVMNSYSDVDSVPAAADSWLLTDLLRGEWGFEGTVVSDYWAVPFLATMHRVAADFDEAGGLALAAGIDVELPDTIGFGPGLVEKVRRRRASGGRRRPRRAPGAHPEGCAGAPRPGLDPEGSIRHGPATWTWTRPPTGPWPARSPSGPSSCSTRGPHCRCSATAGRRWAEWLSSGRARPTRGPSWAATPSPTTYCRATPSSASGIEVQSALDALRAELPDVDVVYERGCEVEGGDRSGFAGSRRPRPEQADLCVAFVGDLAGLFGRGTSGEGCDAEDLRLPGVQADLLEELLATGTPVVVVVVSGRPYALGEVHGRAAGLVQAFMPGEEGGQAIAGVLSGRIQPSGRLPVQIPRRPGGQPGTYLQPPLGAENGGTSNLDPTPLFPFGYGRSLHRLRGGRPADQQHRGAHGRRVHRLRTGAQHRIPGRRGGRPAVPARRRRHGGAAGQAARRLRPRRAGGR